MRTISRILLILLLVHFSVSTFSQQNTWTLHTSDTKIKIGILNGKLNIISLSGVKDPHNWTSAPSLFSLMDTVEADKKKIKTNWKFSRAENKNQSLRLTFVNMEPELELVSEWQANPGPGPVRHLMFVKNNSSKNITIHRQESMQISTGPIEELRATYINDDASWPDSIGVYHQDLSSPFSKKLTISEVQDWIPFVILDAKNAKGMYTGWEWSLGSVTIDASGNTASVRMGNGSDFKTDISPGEIFEVPPAFIGAYTGDLDACGNTLRKYLFNHSMPALITRDKTFPKVEWNAFAATGKKQGSWDPLESKYYPLMDDIAPLGFEEVVIDIGWWESYGDPGHIITDHVDWPSGMAAAAKYAHDRKMRFGLYDNESENLASDSGKTERISDIEYLIKDLHADFYRSDATAGPLVNGAFGGKNRAKYKNDMGYWSIKGFYEVIDSVYKQIPGFLWENCSNGGGLKDYGAVKRCSKIQNQDVYYPIEARKAFYDASHAFHPMQLAGVVGSWDAWQATGSVYEFRSSSMGAAYWHPDAPNGGNGGPVWTPEHKEIIKKAVATYKEKLRPLIRNADLYHIFPRPDNQHRDGVEYYDPATGKGVVYIFQPKETDGSPVFLKGLDRNAIYTVSFEDGSNNTIRMKGNTLMQTGIPVLLKGNETSELLFFSK